MRQVLIEPSGIRDLGIQSLAPELDLIDSLFWRIHLHLPTAQIAAPDVVRALTPQIRQAEIESAKAQEKGVFYIGMIMASLVQHTHAGANVCLEIDGIDYSRFTLRRQTNGGCFIESAQTSKGTCVEDAQPPNPTEFPPQSPK